MAWTIKKEAAYTKDKANEPKETDEQEEITYESIMRNGYNCVEIGITMHKWSASAGKDIWRWDCILDLPEYLHSLSPKVKVQINKKRCGVIIDCGQTIDYNQNIVEHLQFLEMSQDYFWNVSWNDSDIMYVTDIPTFINSLTEEQKKIFAPSMPFLRSYTWCGPPLFLPCNPKEINDIQLKIDSIQRLLNQNIQMNKKNNL